MPMLAAALVSIATVWTAVVVDVVAESASSGGTNISLLGHAIASATPQTGVICLAALAASAAIGLAAALAFVTNRRMGRRMAAELDARWEEVVRNQASEARPDARASQFFEWRRDKLLAEMQQIRERTAALRRAGLEQRASLERFATEVESASRRGETIPELIVIPDVDLGEGASVTSSDSGSSDPA